MLIDFRLALQGRLCVINGNGTQGTIVYSRDKLLTLYFSEKEPQDRSLLKMPTFEYESCIRGYHVYQTIWSSSIGEVLSCRQEPRNAEDPFATGVNKGNHPSFPCCLYYQRINGRHFIHTRDNFRE